MVALLATAFISLGLVNLDFSAGWWRGQRLRLAIGVPIVWAYVYSEMPALVFPQAFVLLLLTLVPNVALSAMLAARTIIAARRIVSLRKPTLVPYAGAVAVLGAFAGVLAVAPILDASGMRDVPDVTISKAAPPNASLEHLRVVPEESAIFAGEKVIGQLGAYYRVGTYNIQVESGRLVWVAPLEFQGFIQWLSRRTSPGVIVVSAERPDAAPELRARAPMRYIPSALLNDNLHRHVYFRYGTEQILGTTLQLDDRGDPQYLCTLGRPTIGWSGQKVTAVAIVDPSSGAMRRVARADFGTLPRWVTRVYPPELALRYNYWFGFYVHGLWNSLLAKRDVHIPARNEVFGLLTGGDRFVWFVDHTSPMLTDQSMTGFTYMDTVSGALTYYTATGGEFNSAGAENAVASHPLVKQGRLVPTQPLLYDVFKRNTWVVPLVADSGKFQSLALVAAQTGHVVVGNAASASPVADALAAYEAFAQGGEGDPGAPGAERSGTVDRIAAAADGAVYFTLRSRRQVYAVPAGSGPAALLARPGDGVRFRVVPATGAETVLSVRDFQDVALRP
jgi:hypothetical protein